MLSFTWDVLLAILLPPLAVFLHCSCSAFDVASLSGETLMSRDVPYRLSLPPQLCIYMFWASLLNIALLLVLTLARIDGCLAFCMLCGEPERRFLTAKKLTRTSHVGFSRPSALRPSKMTEL